MITIIILDAIIPHHPQHPSDVDQMFQSDDDHRNPGWSSSKSEKSQNLDFEILGRMDCTDFRLVPEHSERTLQYFSSTNHKITLLILDYRSSSQITIVHSSVRFSEVEMTLYSPQIISQTAQYLAIISQWIWATPWLCIPELVPARLHLFLCF